MMRARIILASGRLNWRAKVVWMSGLIFCDLASLAMQMIGILVFLIS